MPTSDLMARMEAVDVGQIKAALLSASGAAPESEVPESEVPESEVPESEVPESEVPESVPPSGSRRERQMAEENRKLRQENARLSASAVNGRSTTDEMGLLELVFQGLALGIQQVQLETALTHGTLDGGAAARQALMKLVGSNVKRKTSQGEQPTLQHGPVAVEGQPNDWFRSKPTTVTAHLRHGDAVLGDGRYGGSSGSDLTRGVSRGLLSSQAAPEWQEGRLTPEVREASKALMSRVHTPVLDGDEIWAAQWEESWQNFEETRDPEGERLVRFMVEKITESGKGTWIDADFPPDNQSLFSHPHTTEELASLAEGTGTFRRDQDPFLVGVRGIEWKRACELLNPDEQVVVWSKDIHSDDIKQGALGNCYYLAALGSCAVGDKDVLIRDLIVEEGQDVGVYGVKFYIHGKWVTVPVDDYFPCTYQYDEKTNTNQWKPIFASPSMGEQQDAGEKEIWPLIFEKAWAKLHGSYEATAGGQTCDALNYLSGGITRNLAVHIGNDEEWQNLLSMQEEHNKHEIAHDKEHNPFLSCSVKAGIDSEMCKAGGLISGHAYSVLCVAETKDGHRLLNLRNPWGSFEWKGAFSDGSDEWTEELKLEVGADDSEGDDGSFWMCWADFCTYFDEIGVCDPMFIPKLLLEEGELFPDTCNNRIKTVGSEWRPGVNAGGPPGFCLATKAESITFKHNPSFSIKANANKIMLQMCQTDHRGSQIPTPWTDMYLYLVDDASKDRPKKLLHLQRRQQFVEVEVQPRKEYRIVAAAWGAGVAGRFWISAAAKGLEFNCLRPESQPDEAAKRQMASKPGANGPEAVCIMCGKGPIRGQFYDMDEGQCHSECYEAYDLERKQCTADKCAHCQDRILDKTWSVFKGTDGDISVHKACVDSYQESKAPKCAHCAGPLMGSYSVLSGNNLHSECVDAYREAKAPKCPQCKGPVTGSYYPYGPDETISGKDEKVHVECSDPYDAAVRMAKRYAR